MRHIQRLLNGGLLLALAGCASVDSPKAASDATAQAAATDKPAATTAAPGVGVQREQRKKKVAEDFDLKRDQAEYQSAWDRWQQGDLAGCRQTLATLLARSPDHRAGHILAAQADLFDDKPKNALEHARRILVGRPNDAQAHYLAALALDAMGQMAEALPHYENAARLAPGEDAYRASYEAALGTAVLPAAGVALSDTAAGAERVGQTASIAPAAYTEDAKNAARAGERLATLRQAAADHPTDSQAAQDAAVEALRTQQPALAVEIATAALRQHVNSAALYRILGMAQSQTGDFIAAQAALGRAISLDKSNALAYFLMGSTLARMGESEAARQNLDEAARLDPRYRSN